MAMPGGGIAGAQPFLTKMPPPGLMDAPAAGMQITLPGESSGEVDPETGATITRNPDGGATVEFGHGNDGQLPGDLPWDANLAEHLDERILASIATTLIEQIDDDIKSMEPWLADFINACKALGVRYEERMLPFRGASGVTSTILLDAVVRGSSNASGEMLPAQGPVKVAIYGNDSAAPPAMGHNGGPPMGQEPLDPAIQQKAERKKNFYNYHFTTGDPEFRADFDQMLLLLYIGGTMVRKVYRDLKTAKPISRYLPPPNLIISYSATSVNSGRVTHRIIMDHTELVRMQLAGEYRWLDKKIPKPDNTQTPQQKELDRLQGRRATLADEDYEHEVLECHCDLDIDHPDLQHMQASEDEPDRKQASGMALPYIVTFEKSSRQVLSLRRNWKQGDKLFNRRIRFQGYTLIPGLDFFGFGMGHLVGGMQRAATAALRQFIDGTTLRMFPGGVTIAKAVRAEQNRMPIGPSEFREIDTGGKPINQAFAALPYNDPPSGAAAMIEFITKAGKETGNTAELQVGDGQGNAPVGSVVALLNRATIPESAILKRTYASFAGELGIFEEMLGEDPKAVYPYQVDGKRQQAMGQDFDGQQDVIPVADPNIPTQTARIMQASAIDMLSEKAPPGLFDPREVKRQLLETLGKTAAQIDKLMPPPAQAFTGDLVSEIMMAMQNKPIRATPAQDHLSHIKAKIAALQMPGVVQMPAAQIIMSNVAEHYAFLFRDQVQAAINQQAQQQGQQPMQLPPPGQPLPPQIESQIGSQVGDVMNQVVQQLQAMAGTEGAGAAMIEQNIRLAEIKQKEADSQRKTGATIVQNRTEVIKLQSTTADNAAQRDTDLRLKEYDYDIARLELLKAHIIAGGNVERAHIAMAGDLVGAEVDQRRIAADREKTDATITVAEHGTKQAEEGTEQARLAAEAAKHKPNGKAE